MNVSTPTQGTALTATSSTLDTQQQALAEYQAFRRELDTVRDLIAKDCTDEEMALFAKVCRKSGLDPFSRQIYAIKRNSKSGPKMNIQTGIDGFRVIAERSGMYLGQLGPFWCDDDGLWREVWLGKGAPAAAKVGILRAGWSEPLWAVARTKSYIQSSNPLWTSMPEVMIAKVAEALAIRKAFPNDTSGIYTDEEMDQAEGRSEPSQQQNKPKQNGKPEPLDPAKTQQTRRLMAIAKEKWPALDDKQRPEILKKFCAKRNLLAADADGQASIRASSTEQVKAAADALEAWQPPTKAKEESTPETPTDVQEGELVEDEDLGNIIEDYEAALSGLAPADREAWFRGEIARAKVEAGDHFGSPDDLESWTEEQKRAWIEWLHARSEVSMADEDLGF